MPLPSVHELHEVILATATRQAETCPQVAALTAHDGGADPRALVAAIAGNVAMVVRYRCEVALERDEDASAEAAA